MTDSGFHCCGNSCYSRLPDNIYSQQIVCGNGGFIFCSEACADDPESGPADVITRNCIYYHSTEIEIMCELAE